MAVVVHTGSRMVAARRSRMVGDSLARRVVVGNSLVHLDPDRDPCPCLLVAELIVAELAPPLAPVQYPKRRSVSTPCTTVAGVLGDAVYGRRVAWRCSPTSLSAPHGGAR